MERTHGWQLAEHAGDATPYGIPQLLDRVRWDAAAVRDDLQADVCQSSPVDGPAIFGNRAPVIIGNGVPGLAQLRRSSLLRAVKTTTTTPFFLVSFFLSRGFLVGWRCPAPARALRA